MNIHTQIILALAVVLSFGAFAAEEKGDLKWGVTLGVASLDYESERPRETYDSFENATYTPLVFGIDVGRGKHSVSYKITSAGDEDYNYRSTSTYTDSALLRVEDNKRDHEESTITYQYQLEGGWGLGIQYNDVENSYTGTGKADYEHYDWTYGDVTENALDGFGFFGTFVRIIPDTKWVFAAKLGVALTDYKGTYNANQVISTTDSYYDFIPILNGSTIQATETYSGDASSAIIGLTMAYVVSPKSVVYFNFDTRVDEFDEIDVIANPRTGTGYWAGGPDGGDDIAEEIETPAGLEETTWKFAVEWRYALN